MYLNKWIAVKRQALAQVLGLPPLPGQPLVAQRRKQIMNYLGVVMT